MALSCYLLTALLGLIGWVATQGDLMRTVIAVAGTLAALLLAAAWLGTLRPDAVKPRRHRVPL
ncbi:MAG: hypothetical protein WA192_10245 [Candidatus Acidiferrales bacterium]